MRKRTIFLLILAVVLACVLFFCRFYFLGTSSDPVNAKTNADFQIPDFHSQTDKDADGIDDQTDLLQGARAYIATQPRYKSKYYETGYPNDGYGVCTDVIANAMLSAGYDLKELYKAYASVWASKYRDEYLSYIMSNDVHAPGIIRVNGVLSATDGFYTAFDIKEGDGMYRKPEDRPRIW